MRTRQIIVDVGKFVVAVAQIDAETLSDVRDLEDARTDFLVVLTDIKDCAHSSEESVMDRQTCDEEAGDAVRHPSRQFLSGS